MKKLLYLLLFIIISPNIYCQNKLFYKSKRNYKHKNYIAINMSNMSSMFTIINKSFPYINVSKYPIKLDNKYIYEIKFGYKGMKSEFITLSNDTIFYFPFSKFQKIRGKNELLNIEKKPIFILNNNFKDSVYIEKFGEIECHYLKLENVCYYSKLKDTAYIYSLYFQYPKTNPIEKTSKDRFYFNKIIISKKYGFLELHYVKYLTYLEVRYY